MDQVTHSVPPGFVWPTVGHPGRVPLWAVIPDPKQPRKHFDDEELDALTSTMRAENGGEQREIATVSELTEEEKIIHAPARYKLVSGERRWRSAKRAHLDDFEIRVKAYKSEAHRKLDMYMLNEGRVQLSDIEDARYLAEMMYDFDLTTDDELVGLTGKTKSHVSNHLAILRLVPEVQALMEPTIPERSRLRMGTALVLSRLERSVQADYAERMPKGEGISTRRQADWIKSEIARTGAKARTRELTPGTVRRSIEYLADMTVKRINEFSSHKALENIFDKATPAHKEILLGSVKKMLGKVETLLAKIEGQLPNRPKETQKAAPAVPKPVVAQDLKVTAAAVMQQRSKPVSAMVREVHTPAPKPALRPVSHLAPPRPVLGALARKVAPAPSVVGGAGKEKTVTYFDNAAGRMVMGKVSKRKYLELWDSKSLKFQVKGTEREEWMPTREGAEQDWDKFCE